MCSRGLAGAVEEMAVLDREFHQKLLRLSGNGMLVRLAENCAILGKVIRVGRDPEVVCREHLAILDAIESNRANRAARLMREHIRAGKEAAEAQIKSGKFMPMWVG